MIRSANIEDLNNIELIEQEFGADAFSRRSLRHLILSNNIVLVIDLGGVLVGYLIALLRKDSPKVRLYSIIIHSEHRNKGYAVELIHFLERESKTLGKGLIGLEVREGNYPAISLYDSCGFLRGEKVPGYYPDGETAIKYFKNL
jgi:ribosomal-protein-alanine N-acetyltransferase